MPLNVKKKKSADLQSASIYLIQIRNNTEDNEREAYETEA